MSSSHSTVIYTSKSNVDGSPWGIHLMLGCESESSEAPLSLEQAPMSLAYAPDSLEHAPPFDDDLELAEDQALHAPVLPAPLSPNFSADSEPIKDDPQEANPEDVFNKDPSEENGPDKKPLVQASPLPSSITARIEAWLATPTPPSPPPSPLSPLSSEEETKPFEEDEVALTPPSPTPPFVTPLFEIGESSAAAAARQFGSVLAQGVIDRLEVVITP
ncbi:hypothetical protein Tco_0620658 [Tanacetum coccineum]